MSSVTNFIVSTLVAPIIFKIPAAATALPLKQRRLFIGARNVFTATCYVTRVFFVVTAACHFITSRLE
jgi:hypothetical protein